MIKYLRSIQIGDPINWSRLPEDVEMIYVAPTGKQNIAFKQMQSNEISRDNYKGNIVWYHTDQYNGWCWFEIVGTPEEWVGIASRLRKKPTTKEQSKGV